MTTQTIDTTLSAPPRWRVWLQALRPKTLSASLGPVAVGAALAAGSGSFRPWAALWALLGALLIQIGTNLHNDLADFRSGADNAQRLGPARAAQRGWLSTRQLAWATACAFGAALAVGVGLSLLAGWQVMVIGVVSLLAGLAYTGGPWPLGYHGWGDLCVLIFFGNVAVCGTAWVCSGRLDAASLAASFPVGLLATSILVVNNLRDRHTDALAGKRTLAVRLGARFARAEHGFCLIGAYLILPFCWWTGWGHAGWLLPWLSFPLAVAELRALARVDGAALNPHLGRNAALGLLFCLLLAGGMLL